MPRDRIIASILAGAIGDGWGRPYEGRPPPPRVEIPRQLLISDDTQLTLATCDAVIEARRVDPERIAASFVKWFREGRITGLGASTLKALRDLDAGAHWALSGAKGEHAAGNGAAMRVAPLAFVLDPTIPEHRTTLREVCRITHHHDEAYIGGQAVVVAIRLACQIDYDLDGLLRDVAKNLTDSQVRDRLNELAELPSNASVLEVAARFGISGFVVHSVPLALFAARRVRGQELVEVLRDTILAGGDTDTIASIAGQVAGAAIGRAGLPEELLDRLHGRDQITQIAERFADHKAAG